MQAVSQTQAAYHPVTHIFWGEQSTNETRRQDIGSGTITAPISGATNVKGNSVSIVVSGITLPATVSGDSNTTLQMTFDPSALSTFSLDNTGDR